MEQIQTFLVNGFLDAGKTTYLNRILEKDFFYKRGKTLLLSFEEGEEDYDKEMLSKRNTVLEVYDDSADPIAWCISMTEKHQPDRVYMETNSMMDVLWEDLPEVFRVVFSVTLMDGNTLNLYYNNMRGHMQRMLQKSNMVIFTQSSKECIEPMGTAMKLMNNKCDFLWQSPQGYSERAFGVTLPFDFSEDEYHITEDIYANWYLDVVEHPEHYDGKKLYLEGQLLKEEKEGTIRYKTGRRVMVCCIADISFLGITISSSSEEKLQGYGEYAWISAAGQGQLVKNAHGLARLELCLENVEAIMPKEHPIIGMK